MNYALLLGSNLGDRQGYLRTAQARLAEQGVVWKASSVFETKPWGMASNNLFLNQTIIYEADLLPRDMLRRCHDVENALGRVRSARPQADTYADRTIDIDILLAEQLQVSQPDLVIPHPRMALRRFALTPLAEVAADWIVPPTQITVRQLLDVCPDLSDIARV